MGEPQSAAVQTDPQMVTQLTGVAAGTQVLTLDGELPVQFLAPGDRIITRAGARPLRQVSVHLIHNAQMVRIAGSARGQGRREVDLFLPPAQVILLRDPPAKPLFGKASALAEAQRLSDGEYIRYERVAEVRLFTLHFDREEIIFAGGLELACPGLTPTA